MIEITYIRIRRDYEYEELVKVHKLMSGTLVLETVSMKSSMKIITREEFDKLEEI